MYVGVCLCVKCWSCANVQYLFFFSTEKTNERKEDENFSNMFCNISTV